VTHFRLSFPQKFRFILKCVEKLKLNKKRVCGGVGWRGGGIGGVSELVGNELREV
jgi:hypothetical protein